jgi:asparagine synthase (glutamine-hydrolysing)
MCGILGILTPKAPPSDSSRLLASLRHRGPDRQAEWTSPDGSVWLGHTRLSILDLSEAGDQPMRDEATGNILVLNGEIYNHLDLRRELESLGISFRGHSDTETVLRGYGAWGPALFPRLRGMFALAIYEVRSREVVLARDRFGIKPLYLARTESGGLAFASEVRTLLSLAGRKLSPRGLSAFLHWGACSHRALIFENIHEFPAGCWARLQASGEMPAPVRFWPLSPEPIDFDAGLSAAEPSFDPVHTVRRLLEDSVEAHLLADVPVACFLSGGIDSSILTAMASRSLGRGRLATFSVGFAEKGFDESEFARQMAELHGTKHHHVHLNEKQKLPFLQRAVDAMDLPSIDAANTYIVSNHVASAGFKVVLSGLGADEIFGGYPLFRDFSTVRSFAGIPRPFAKILKAVGKGNFLLSDIPLEKNGETLSRWWRRIWTCEQISRIGLPIPDFHHEPSPPLRDAMAELSWGEITHYMRDTLLRDSDAMSMAHSIELRVPFLDNALVQTVLAYSAKEKFNPRLPKSLLLAATKDLLPEQIWNRPKMGFSLPMADWMRGPLADFCRVGLDHLVSENLLNSKNCQHIWSDFQSGKTHWPVAWSATVLGHYLQNNRA